MRRALWTKVLQEHYFPVSSPTIESTMQMEWEFVPRGGYSIAGKLMQAVDLCVQQAIAARLGRIVVGIIEVLGDHPASILDITIH